MHRIRPVLVGVAAALAAGSTAGGAFGSPASTPEFQAGTPSCAGLVVAALNHASGPAGPSGNANASAGPGAFLGSGTHDGIESFARATFC